MPAYKSRAAQGSATETVARRAADYTLSGFTLVPILHGLKGPRGSAWQGIFRFNEKGCSSKQSPWASHKTPFDEQYTRNIEKTWKASSPWAVHRAGK